MDLKGYCVVVLFSLALCASINGIAAERQKTPARASRESKAIELSLVKSAEAPVIDGKADDACWKAIRETRVLILGDTGKSITARLKTCEYRGVAYMLLNYECPKKKDNRICWRWDPVRHAYFISGEKETALTLIFRSRNPSTANFADVWVWRHSRNDPANFADDMSLTGKYAMKPGVLKMDAGISPWFSRYFAEFAGDELSRFYSRTPSGSAGDVKGRSSIKDGMVVYEFARKLKTGNSDDIDLDTTFSLRIMIN